VEFIPHLLIEESPPVLPWVQTYPISTFVGEYMWVYKILERAIAEAKAAGLVGKNILGTGYDLELYVHIGAGAYICVKKTLIESWKEKRGIPYQSHHFPAVSGLVQPYRRK
jgi:NADH-quinone oxidoreductase subunit F